MTWKRNGQAHDVGLLHGACAWNYCLDSMGSKSQTPWQRHAPGEEAEGAGSAPWQTGHVLPHMYRTIVRYDQRATASRGTRYPKID